MEKKTKKYRCKINTFFATLLKIYNSHNYITDYSLVTDEVVSTAHKYVIGDPLLARPTDVFRPEDRENVYASLQVLHSQTTYVDRKKVVSPTLETLVRYTLLTIHADAHARAVAVG